MGRIVYLPFENLPQRYTQMWNEAIIKNLSGGDIVVSVENKPQVITTGEFLDVYSTSEYKHKQLGAVCELFKNGKIKDGDTFFVPDIFYSGIETIKYIAELVRLKVKIVAFNHAGRADESDFVQRLSGWADTQEKAWHYLCDLVLVGSRYHAERVRRKFGVNSVVTGAVWDSEWMIEHTKGLGQVKKPFVIYPHRPCQEKRFDFFLEIAKKNPKLRFIITSCGPNRLQGVELPKNVIYRYNLTKREYFDIFSQTDCYLSTAYQETFGYTVQEAIFFGCKIACPDWACYREFVNEKNIVPFELMAEEGFLTEFYQRNDLRLSAPVKDNAKEIIKIVRRCIE